jgi:hypothetical protein
MFLENKYTKTYLRLMEKAIFRTKPEGYTERHHIIPKSLPNTYKHYKFNLVILTVKEHFIAHLLLSKMLPEEENKKKMIDALHTMITKCFERDQYRYIPCPRILRYIKELKSTSMKGRNNAMANPIYRENMKKGTNTVQHKEGCSKRAIALWSKKEHQEKMSEHSKKLWENPEYQLK